MRNYGNISNRLVSRLVENFGDGPFEGCDFTTDEAERLFEAFVEAAGWAGLKIELSEVKPRR